VKRERAAEGKMSVADVCASFQEAVADVLVAKVVRAAVETETGAIFLTGGVAANSRLRELLGEECREAEINLFYPSPELCTDNAAMVAACGFHRYQRGIWDGIDLAPDPNLPLA
jgi:tRNA N6-adenosine threonylcarbamoyltransferase